jgi:O-antigen ligase
LVVLLFKKLCEKKTKLSTVLYFVFSSLIIVAGILVAYMFGGRISMAAMFVFLLLVLLTPLKISTTVYKWACIGIFLSALILPIIYIHLYNTIGDFEILGKSFFSGRQDVWKSAFEQIAEYPLFGSGTAFSMGSVGGSSTQSAHNTVIGLWKNVGIIPLVSVVVCFFTRRYRYITLEDRAIFALLVIMFTETFFMDSHFSFIFLLFMLRSHDEVEELPKTNRFNSWIQKKKNDYLQRKEAKKAK